MPASAPLFLPLNSQPFDLAETLHSGQVFHWSAEGAGFVGAVDSDAVYLEQCEDGLLVEGASETIIRRYLGLEDNMTGILETFPGKDLVLQRAVAATPGLRIVRQPTWECLATFITSSLKQVPHIRQISLTLRERFGELRSCRGVTLFSYPAPETLASAGEEALRRCGLGYRAKSLAKAAREVADGTFDLDEIARLEDDDLACRALCGLHGVGDKIAHCVLLFAYGRLGAFPIDVWVERVLVQLYAKGPQKKRWRREEMLAFARGHFGPYAGYAQQFLFHYARRHHNQLFARGPRA